MYGEGFKHWTGTLIVAVTAGFVIFGLVYGQDFLSGFLKDQETKIEVESEFIEQKEEILESSLKTPEIIPYREAVILTTPIPTPSNEGETDPVVEVGNAPEGASKNSGFTTGQAPESETSTAGPTPMSYPINTLQMTPALSPTPIPTPESTPTPTPAPQQVQSQCQQGQVDINTGSKQELLKIKHIGNVRADELITLRPFSSVVHLIKINGIGPKTLQDIKNEGIACVQ